LAAWKQPGRAGGGSWLAWAGYAIVLALAPWVWDTNLGLTLLSQMGVAIIGCLAFNLLLGQGGMLSFGHAVYAGLGAFCAIHTLRLVNAGVWALPVSLVPLAGGLAGLGLAALLGYVTTRKAGTPFAMITLGVGELVWAVSLMFPAVFGGEGGISANRVVGESVLGVTFGPPLELYYLIGLYTFVCTALLYAFTRTPLGRMLNAVRENPERAACVGYDPRLVRYLAFMVSGFFMGVSGGLAALNFEIVTTEVLGAARSGAYLLFTFVGGTMVFYGPIIGAVLMVLALVLFSTLTQAWLLYLGLLFMAMVMFAPGGVAGWLQGWGAGLGACRRGGPGAAAMRRRLAARLALAVPLLMAALGGTALVEMAYHRQLNAALGPQMRWLGLTLDTTQPGHWLSMLLWVAAALAAVWALRRWQRRTRPAPGVTP
jgi:branched-chain amino acid transport system permease protein